MSIKYIPIEEFRKLGLLQEVNRQFFHPIGLALEVHIDDDGVESLGGVWDYRDDPEGMVFGKISNLQAIKNVENMRDKHREARYKMFGTQDIVQPPSWELAPPDTETK